MSDKPLRILDTCSGIGGFSYAAEYLSGGNFETAAFIEIDDHCQKVLRARWPNTPIYGDIKEYKYDKKRDGKIDILCSGYPCQPFSLSGHRGGEKDDRHIWPEVLRILRDVRPHWCFFENVNGHLSLGIRQVLSDMEQAGYSTRIFIIPALAVDAQHERERLWIIATDEGAYTDESFYKLSRKKPKNADPLLHTRCDETGLWPTPLARDYKGASQRTCSLPNAVGEGSERAKRLRPELFRTPVASSGGSCAQYLIDRNNKRDKGARRQIRLQDQIKVLEGDGKTPAPGRLNPDWVEWLMGYPTGYTHPTMMDVRLSKIPFEYESWSEEPQNIPRLTENPVLRSKRIRSLGNSIVPQLAARFFHVIASVEGNISDD